MKVESVLVSHFKRFDHLEVSFKDQTLDEISDRFLILGDNGQGKTTLLQAIALPLALATGQISQVYGFDWPGFLPGRYARWGKPHIEIVVTFTDSEVQKTQELASRWVKAQTTDFNRTLSFVPPADSHRVTLVLDGESCYAGTPEEYKQFQGRAYALQLVKTDPTVREDFKYLPGIFWFDQFRNLSSVRTSGVSNGGNTTPAYGRLTYDPGVAQLRRYLNGWALARLSHSTVLKKDYLTELESLYNRVFPGRSFAGVEPMPGIDAPTADDYYFLLNDGQHTYDIVEMSSGEQNVFPILYEFIRQQIASSLVLIDEVDLNLHPSAAQTLVTQLPQIGPDCQFIITTHSDAVNSIIGDEETYRLPGGSLCL